MWAALTSAVAGRHIDKAPYDYLVVRENLPESLVVWQDGKVTYQTPVNTGVPGAVQRPGHGRSTSGTSRRPWAAQTPTVTSTA